MLRGQGLEQHGGVQAAVRLGVGRAGIDHHVETGIDGGTLQRRSHEPAGRDLGHDRQVEGLLGGTHGPQAAVEHLDQQDDPDRHHQADGQSARGSVSSGG